MNNLETQLLEELRTYKDALKIATDALREYAEEGNWFDCLSWNGYMDDSEVVIRGQYGEKGYKPAQKAIINICKILTPDIHNIGECTFRNFSGCLDSNNLYIYEDDLLFNKDCLSIYKVKYGEHTTTTPAGYENVEANTNGWYLESITDSERIFELTKEEAKKWTVVKEKTL